MFAYKSLSGFKFLRMNGIRSKSKITKEEIFADIVFFCVSGLITFLLIFFFDIHHSFYSWPFSLEFIFSTLKPYFVLVPIGTIIGFLIIKLLFYALKKEKYL